MLRSFEKLQKLQNRLQKNWKNTGSVEIHLDYAMIQMNEIRTEPVDFHQTGGLAGVKEECSKQ